MAARGGNAQDWTSWYHDAQVTAAALPALLVDASRIAQTIAAGWHGRRRAGPGENFWQFRRFNSSDAPTRIDWRRSARDIHLFVREQEWEAAHTVWLWPDRSASMAFRSNLAPVSKEERAIVMALVLAELLVRGGERIAIPSLTRPSPDARAPRRLAEALAREGRELGSLPSTERLNAHSDYVILSDFLDPFEELERRVRDIVATGVRPHLVQIFDPIEESFPFKGRAEFIAVEGKERFLAKRAEALREAYHGKLAALRDALHRLAVGVGGTFMIHHTDKPPHATLLGLHEVLAAPREFAAAQPSASSDEVLSARLLREVAT